MNDVKNPKKPLIYYYLIVLVVIMLLNATLVPMLSQRNIQQVDYSTFLTMLSEGQIG